MFARFDENPAMTQDIKKKKTLRMDGRTHAQHENSIPTTNKVCGGYKKHTNFLPCKELILPTDLFAHGFFFTDAASIVGLSSSLSNSKTWKEGNDTNLGWSSRSYLVHITYIA